MSCAVRAYWDSTNPTHPFTNAMASWGPRGHPLNYCWCRAANGLPNEMPTRVLLCVVWLAREDRERDFNNSEKNPVLSQLLLQLCAPSVAGPPFVLASWPPFVCADRDRVATLCCGDDATLGSCASWHPSCLAFVAPGPSSSVQPLEWRALLRRLVDRPAYIAASSVLRQSVGPPFLLGGGDGGWSV